MDAVAKRAAPSTRCYQRRRPEKTLWYRIVQTHFETWLELSDRQSGESQPTYVERAFRRYLECGILMKQLAIRLSCQETTAKSLVMAHGFARAYCDECQHDFLIAF